MKPKRRLNIFAILAIGFLILLILLLVNSWVIGANTNINTKDFINKCKENKEEVKVYGPSQNARGVVVTCYNKTDKKTYSSYFISWDFFKEKAKDFIDDAQQLEAFPQNIIFSFLGTIVSFLPFLFIIAFYFFIFYRAGGGMNPGGKFSATKPKKSNILFSDVAGIVEEKKELMEVVEFLKIPQKFIKMGARIPKGVLLAGPPGTGKTLLAKAVSGEAEVPFFSATGSSFEEVYVGLGASRIREIFKKAKEVAPSIIFIDEIDSLGDARGSVSSYKHQTLNQFLAEMDGFEPNAGVIVIAATNRADFLDPALVRSGRFDRKVQVNLPDVREREAILKIHARNKNVENSVSLSDVAERTPGFSGAQLENSLNEAALVAVRRAHNKITSGDIDEGIDRVIGGPAKTSKIISPQTKLLISIHEAGHALIGLILADAFRVQKVTIIPRGSAGGYTVSTPKQENSIMTKESLLHQIVGLLGGRAAEQFQFGKYGITTGAHDDFLKASNLAKRMVQEFGMSDMGLRYSVPMRSRYTGLEDPLSNKSKEKEDEYIENILNDCFQWATELIVANTKLLHLLAETLLILETITISEITHIYKERTLPTAAETKKKNNPDKKYFDLSILPKKNLLKKDNKKFKKS